MTIKELERALNLPTDKLLLHEQYGATLKYTDLNEAKKIMNLRSFTYYPNDNLLVYDYD